MWWRGLRPEEDGRFRMAVNLRMAAPEAVAHIPIDHFDGLDTFEDLPRKGKCVADYWAWRDVDTFNRLGHWQVMTQSEEDCFNL
jgi:hypothetical protein